MLQIHVYFSIFRLKEGELKDKNSEIKDQKAEIKAKDLEIKKIKDIVTTVALPTKRGRSNIANSHECNGIDEDSIALKISKLLVNGVEHKVIVDQLSVASENIKEEIKHAVTAKELELTKQFYTEQSKLSENYHTSKFTLAETYHKDQMLREDSHRENTRADTSALFTQFYELAKLFAPK